MPQARARGGTGAAHRLDRAPHCLARPLDAHARLVYLEPRCTPFSWPRQIGGAQRIELCNREARAKIFAGLAHPAGDRAAALHHGEGIDGAIGSGGPTGFVGDRPLHQFDDATTAAFRRGPALDITVEWMVLDASRMGASHLMLSNKS